MTYSAQGRTATYANSDAATSATYTYDGSGQRTKSVVTVGSTTTTTSFAYDGLTLLFLSAVQGSTTWRIDYLYDEEGTPWGGVYRSPASSTNPTYFTIVTSDRGDALELCDADGAAFAAYRYDAWGLPQGAGSYATGVWTQSTALVTSTLAGQIASRQVLRYAGYAFDAESSLYYCSARYYDPATRQWTTGDPAKADGEESPYQYCGGDPVGAVDGSGQTPRVFRWPGPYASHSVSTSYLKYVLRTNVGWLHAEYGLNRISAGLRAKELTKNYGDWDFKRGDETTTCWLGGPIGYHAYSRTITYGRRIGKAPLHQTAYYASYGRRHIDLEDFGNIHFGYVMGYCFEHMPGAFSIARAISQTRAREEGRLDDDEGRQNEVHDQAMVRWGFELYDRWGYRAGAGRYFERPR
jgi:RHS repeat-associated protein